MWPPSVQLQGDAMRCWAHATNEHEGGREGQHLSTTQRQRCLLELLGVHAAESPYTTRRAVADDGESGRRKFTRSL
jgi:hypothetical protein